MTGPEHQSELEMAIVDAAADTIARLTAQLAEAREQLAALTADLEKATAFAGAGYRSELALRELRTAARALCDALPRCRDCAAAGVRRHGSESFACDAHGRFQNGDGTWRPLPETEYATALRALLATLDGAAGGEASADEKGGGG